MNLPSVENDSSGSSFHLIFISSFLKIPLQLTINMIQIKNNALMNYNVQYYLIYVGNEISCRRTLPVVQKLSGGKPFCLTLF